MKIDERLVHLAFLHVIGNYMRKYPTHNVHLGVCMPARINFVSLKNYSKFTQLFRRKGGENGKE